MENQEQVVEFNFEESFVIRATNEENNDYIITCGDKIATPKHYQSEEEAEKTIKNKDWNLIATLTIAIAEQAVKNYINEQIKKEQK